MVRKEDILVMRAVALCFKPYLKPEEACIYCNLGRTQLAKKCEEKGVVKSQDGYYKREDLDRVMSGEAWTVEDALQKLSPKKRR